MLGFPRRPVVRFFLDRWRDVSLDVRQKPAITITPGSKDWAAKPSPALCKFTLDDGPDNGDGDYDPDNPLGQWYDYLSRNTPVTFGLHYGQDLFDRTVGSGWSTSPDMGVWSSFQSAGTVASDVTGGAGRHLITSTNAFIAHYLDDVHAKDVDVYDEWTVGAIDVTAAAFEPANLMLRGQGTGTSYYMLRTELTTAEQVTLRIMHANGTLYAGPITVMAYPGAASGVGVRFQADGNTLRGKTWRLDQGEPLDWHIEYSLNPATDTMLGAGWVGVRDGVASGNTNAKPIVVSHAVFTVELPRFAGETSKMVPKVSVDHADWRTEVECAAVRRRLARGEKVLDTALRRYITRLEAPFSIPDYWPLDQEAGSSSRNANLFGGATPVFSRGPVSGLGGLEYGIDTKLLATPKGVRLATDGGLRFNTTSSLYNNATGHGVMWLQKLGPGCLSVILYHLSAGPDVTVKFTQGLVELYVAGTVSAAMTVAIPGEGEDTTWHTFAVGVRQSGGNVLYHLAIDDDAYEVSLAGTTSTPVYFLAVTDDEPNSTLELSQVLFINRGIFNFINSEWPYTTLRRMYLGRTSEHAGTRFARLCTEEGVSSSVVGTAAETPAMGPQRPLPLLKLTDECIDVDQGSGIDPRGTTGLGMRTHRATVAQDPVLVLDYASGHVAPEFAGATDDQGALNDVTAKRPDGGEYRVEQTSGPNNTADPGTNPQAAGRADTTVTVTVASDVNLPDQAGWRVHMGTVEGPRYPTVTVDLASDDIASDPELVAAILAIGVGDRIDITGATIRRIFDDVRLVVRGYTETIGDAHQHKIVFNASPYAPLNVGVYGDTDSRWGSAATSLASGLTSSATSFTVNVTKGQPWTTTAARFPMHIWIGGERIRLSAIAAPSSATPPLTQVFTVDTGGRAVNNVAKAHLAGAAVRLFDPVYYGH